MMQQFPPIQATRQMVFRVTDGGDAGLPLPLNVRSVGHYRLPPGHREDRLPGPFTELFWTVRGAGQFARRNQIFEATVNDIFFYHAQEPHRLLAGPGGWEYRWLTLDGAHVLPMLKHFGLPRARPAGPCPTQNFDLLATLLQQPTGSAAREASIIAYAVLEAAGRNPARDRPGRRGITEAARLALDEGFTDPATGIDSIARALRVHRTTLLRIFTAAHGISPSTYLARRRLQHALALLRTTSHSVADIAAATGFRSAEYLARVVRSATGVPPRKFRRDDATYRAHP